MDAGKILIVDDLKLTLDISKSVLADAGCRILTASNGQDALEAIRREKPDLVITDLFMPVMNGDDFCREVKKDPSLSHIPFILISSHAKLKSLDKWAEGLFEDILIKPFGKGEFLDTVQKHLDIRCRKHERFSVDEKVFYKCEEKASPGRLLNIGMGGIYIEGNQFLPKGSRVDIAVLHKKLGCVELFGKVVWAAKLSGEDPSGKLTGLGIEFVEENPNLGETVGILSGRQLSGSA